MIQVVKYMQLIPVVIMLLLIAAYVWPRRRGVFFSLVNVVLSSLVVGIGVFIIYKAYGNAVGSLAANQGDFGEKHLGNLVSQTIGGTVLVSLAGYALLKELWCGFRRDVYSEPHQAEGG